MSAADATEDGAVEGAVERGHAVMSAAGSDARVEEGCEDVSDEGDETNVLQEDDELPRMNPPSDYAASPRIVAV